MASNRTKEGATSEGATSGKGTCEETLGNGNGAMSLGTMHAAQREWASR